MELRKVKYFQYEYVTGDDGEELKNENGNRYMIGILAGVAKFHQFGVSYEELENGIGNFSTAIIELEDGTVKNISCDLIQFIK